MSSILNALKRVETDGSGNPDALQPTTPWQTHQEVRPRGSDRIWEMLVTNGSQWAGICLVTAVLVAVGVTAGLLAPSLFQREQHQQKLPLPDIASHQAAGRTRASVPTGKIRPPRHPLSPPTTAGSIHAPGKTDSPSAPPGIAASPRVTPGSKSRYQAVSVVAASKTLPAAKGSPAWHLPPKPGILPTRVRVAPPRPSAAPRQIAKSRPTMENSEKPADPPSDPQPLPTEAQLHLQAVSWSQTVPKRIAVINNRVLHAGEPIAGYTVGRIDPDAVILSRAGADYRLTFRPR